jgi:hypothetical protein|tara:strand:+ start:139 stop:552 length:414 start_codon:yes stop_codon:yes gene_type:complete
VYNSKNLFYNSPSWDAVCANYFTKSNIFVEKFYGDVLYIGMGNAYGPRKQSKKVTSTTIVEKYSEIIEQYNVPSENWKIINDCAFDVDLKNNTYDIIFIDIWAGHIIKKELNILNKKYKEHLKNKGKILISKILKIK